MKHKNIFTVSLAALAATATVCSAQETEPDLSQAIAIGDAPAVTIFADEADAAPEQVRTTVISTEAAATPVAAIAQARSPAGKTYIAQSKNTDATPHFETRLTGIVGRGHATGRVLVIPKDASDAKSLVEVEEDLGVMAHILDKAVSSDDKTARAMGIALSKWPGSTALQNLYIEGHGVLFFQNVNYPLLPPPAKEGDTTVKEKTSSEWEEARREISEQAKPAGGASFGGGGWNAGAAVFALAPAAEYDADKVEDLKKDLIAALKNAAHIRKLKSDETVTVVVNGPGAVDAKGKRRVAAVRSGEASALGDLPMTGEFSPWDAAHSEPQAKLILRAEKADAEAFQTGKLSFDEFRKKVTVMLY